MERLLRASEVIERVPYSIQHIYRLMNAGQFPRSYKIGRWRVAWKESEVQEWIEQRERNELHRKIVPNEGRG